jgi:hypothetical protein
LSYRAAIARLIFKVTDHALDAVALAIHAPVPVDFGLASGFGRNAGTDAGPMQAGAENSSADLEETGIALIAPARCEARHSLPSQG